MKRIRRDFRQPGSAVKFLVFCQKVIHALSSMPNLPEPILSMLKQLIEKVAAFDAIYHEALDGARSVIRERDRLIQEIVLLLDQLASALESAFASNPDALLSTGFNVSQERRSTPRVKLPLVALQDFTVTNAAEQGRGIAKGTPVPGALIHEIHINQKDPAIESDWLHKSNFASTDEMIMDGLNPGPTFFRIRPFGVDGAGPWSAVVSLLIT